jgi:alpha-tubulin suppressor-like RCC1 family protein
MATGFARERNLFLAAAAAALLVTGTASAAGKDAAPIGVEKSKNRGSPVVSISAAPGSVSPGGTVTLSWSASNASSCNASGGWSGARAAFGTEAVTGLSESRTFTLTCTGKKKKTGSGSVTVVVGAPAGSDLTGTWTFHERLAQSSPGLECANVGLIVVTGNAADAVVALRVSGTCVSADRRQEYSMYRRGISPTISSQSLKFTTTAEFPFSGTCEYAGSIDGAAPGRISGTVTCVGSGPAGSWQAEKGEPVPERFDSTVAIEAGTFSSCAITANGQAFCWGMNMFSQLGTGDTDPRIVPAKVNSGLLFKKISIAKGGGSHSCGITTDGAAYCWGNRSGGRLGDGVKVEYPEYSAAPVLVAGGRQYLDISAGGDHVCAVATDGTAYCWGYNAGGQLGTGDNAQSLIPVPVAGGHKFKSISANILSTCAIATTGAAYCWGSNISPGNGTEKGGNAPALVDGGLQFDSISVGMWFVCGVTSGGDGYCWGDNGVGNLGNGSLDRAAGLVTKPVKVVGDLKWKAITAAVSLACGVTVDGIGYCWGGNSAGERGTGSFGSPEVAEPQRIAGDLRFTSISADWQVCGVSTDRVAYCWGPGDYGAVGDGTLLSKNVPTMVAGQK